MPTRLVYLTVGRLIAGRVIQARIDVLVLYPRRAYFRWHRVAHEDSFCQVSALSTFAAHRGIEVLAGFTCWFSHILVLLIVRRRLPQLGR